MDAITPESRLRQMNAAWNRFWFTPSDPTVLGAIRILTGLITFYTLLVYSFDLQDLMGNDAWMDLQVRQEQYRELPMPAIYLSWDEFGNLPPPTAEQKPEIDAYRDRWGYDPRMVMSKGLPVWSVWFHVVDPFWMNVVHGSIVLCSFLFLIGFGTRITSVLTWFGALCYIHRDPAALFGVDTMMVVLLMYLMIGPSGAALSVDRWLQCRRARRLGLPQPALVPSVSATLAVRLMQIHLCIIYMSAGLAKLQGIAWWTGTAPWATMANYEYAPMHVSLYVDFLRFLAKHRWLYELTMTASAIGTLAFEIGYPFVIWQPKLRNLWLWVAAVLHLGIGMFMGLRTFSLMMVAFNLAFVAPSTVHWAINRILPTAWRAEPQLAPAMEQPQPGADAEKQTRSAAIVRQEKPAKPLATPVKHKR
jgi:hypothetical protein